MSLCIYALSETDQTLHFLISWDHRKVKRSSKAFIRLWSHMLIWIFHGCKTAKTFPHGTAYDFCFFPFQTNHLNIKKKSEIRASKTKSEKLNLDNTDAAPKSNSPQVSEGAVFFVVVFFIIKSCISNLLGESCEFTAGKKAILLLTKVLGVYRAHVYKSFFHAQFSWAWFISYQ